MAVEDEKFIVQLLRFVKAGLVGLAIGLMKMVFAILCACLGIVLVIAKYLFLIVLGILALLLITLGGAWLVFLAAFHWFDCSFAASAAWSVGYLFIILSMMFSGSSDNGESAQKTESASSTQTGSAGGYWRGDTFVNNQGVPTGRRRNTLNLD